MDFKAMILVYYILNPLISYAFRRDKNQNLGTDQTCFTLQSDAIGARSRIAAGFEAIHRAFEV